MNRNTAIIVHAYAGDRHQVENNMPLYLHHNCPVGILSPTDAPIERVPDRRVRCFSAGLKGWIGAHTLEREVLQLKLILEKFPHEHFLLHDADSICLSPQLPQYLYDNPHLFWSNEVQDTNPGPSMLPKLAFQPPYFVNRATIQALVTAKPATSYYGEPASPDGWPMPFPTECIDHYLLQLVYGAKLPHFNFHTGASFETASQHGLNTMVGLVRDHGRELIHSVKTLDALKPLIAARADFLRK